MTREDEAEAWVRKSRRVVHNQFLIGVLAVLAIAMPLPLIMTVFWAMFGLGSPVIIQCVIVLWVAATVVYAALAAYARRRQRKL
jgi:hypothetical protein